MKQPKVISASSLPPPPSVVVGPRYLYTTVPPETVTLRVGDLIPHVPQDSWILGSDAGVTLEVAASEIFGGPVPQLSLSRLAELAPKSFRVAEGAGQTKVKLPVARLVSAYQLISKRELIEDPTQSYVPTVIDDIPTEDLPATFAATVDEEFAPPLESMSEASAVVESPEVEFPTAESTSKEMPEFASPVAEPPAKPVVAPSNRRLFSVLPIFRRKEAEAVPEQTPATENPIPTARRPRVELPPLKTPGGHPIQEEGAPSALPQSLRPPKPPLGAITAASWLAQPPVPPPPAPVESESELAPESEFIPEAPPVHEPMVQELPEVAVPEVPAPEPAEAVLPPPPPILVPPAPAESSALYVETEHFHASESTETVLANQDELQAIFLTEEHLTPERIMELAGSLPGINSCVLSRGGGVIAAHNVPDSIDLISLSAHALEMIRAMRESSAKMGVGAVPAVTIHSEKGPITFFHEDDLCFLVLHKDRGFVPGVREKLQMVVHHLAQARLPRPVSQPSRILEG